MTLTISVALATYNGSRFVEAQLRSILAQDRLPDELVLSDDGSIDGTVDIVRRIFAEEAPDGIDLVVVPLHSRVGVVANFELALRACTGDLIALCDQDDVWHRDRISSGGRRFDGRSDLLLEHGDAIMVGDSGEPLGYRLLEALSASREEIDGIEQGAAFPVYLRRNLATGATFLFRRRLLESALPIPREWVHDEWLAIIASSIGVVGLSRDCLIDYRQHGSNQIGARKPTLRYRMSRLFEDRAGRYAALSQRADVLVQRLEALGVADVDRALAVRKAVFERARAGYADNRVRRLPAILRQVRSCSYSTLSSQGWLDVIRDIVQRA